MIFFGKYNNFSFFKTLKEFFSRIIWDIKNVKNKQLNNSRVLKVKNCNFELENDFKTINTSINDIGNVLKKELTKNRAFTKNTWHNWYDWLINYIPEPIKKTVRGVENQIIGLLKIKDYIQPKRVKHCTKNEAFH